MTTVQREESQKTRIDDNATMTEKEDSAVLADIATPTSDAVDIEDAEEEIVTSLVSLTPAA